MVRFFLVFLFVLLPFRVFFFFNDTATTEIYTLSLHDALPISRNLVYFGHVFGEERAAAGGGCQIVQRLARMRRLAMLFLRSEEHTSELQSPCNLVCRLLLEKKKSVTFIIFSLSR